MTTNRPWPAAIVAALALTGICRMPIIAQSTDAKPAMTIEGPQGIGLRVAPIPADAPRFDAASIRPDKSGEMAPTSQGELVHVTGSRLIAPYITTRELIRNAYNLQHVPRSFIVGGPSWIDGERFNVQAVTGQPFERQQVVNVPPPSAAAMLRALLADRFHLKAHLEVREMPVYELVLDRGDGKLGPGLTPTKAECLGVFELVDLATINRGADPPVEGRKRLCPFYYNYGPDGILENDNMSMKNFSMFLGLIVSINRAVIDRTGLTDRYDVKLRFTGEMQMSATSAPLPREVTSGNSPTLPEALRQQLGLRLRSVRAPVEVLVIDNVERPSEN